MSVTRKTHAGDQRSTLQVKCLAFWNTLRPSYSRHITSWVSIGTPNDRPKSVRNRCVIEDFGDVFVLSRCFLDFCVDVRAFVIGLSQMFSFFSAHMKQN